MPSRRRPSPADYIALGHIHRAQNVAKSEHIRYSGSPIPLSFDELGKAKSVFPVDFADGTLQQVEALTIPQFQPMQLIKGDLAEIERQLQQFADYAGELPVWLDIEVATQDYLSDIQRRIQLMADELPVEVVLLRRSKEQRRRAIAQQDKETLNELSVNEVFERRPAQEADMPEARQRRMHQLFRQWSMRCSTILRRPTHEDPQPAVKTSTRCRASGKLTSPPSRSPATACSPLPARPARAKPPCWTPSARRCTTRRRVSTSRRARMN